MSLYGVWVLTVPKITTLIHIVQLNISQHMLGLYKNYRDWWVLVCLNKKGNLKEMLALSMCCPVDAPPSQFPDFKMTAYLPLTAIWTLSRTSRRPAMWKRTRWTWGVRILSPFWGARRAQSNYISKRSAATFTQGRASCGGENRQIKCGTEYRLLCKLQRTKMSQM